MSLVNDIILYLIEALGGLFLGMVILRFLLQWARADFYNPVTQAIVKITQPLLAPLRRVIPSVMGLDIACIVLAILIQVIIGELISLVLTHGIYNIANLLLFAVIANLKITTYIFFVAFIVLVISSFVAPYSANPFIALARQLTEPLAQPIQRLIPPIGGLDFSVFFLFIGINILQKVLDAVAVKIGLFPLLVIGY